jgi:hypothetical protein
MRKHTSGEVGRKRRGRQVKEQVSERDFLNPGLPVIGVAPEELVELRLFGGGQRPSPDRFEPILKFAVHLPAGLITG